MKTQDLSIDDLIETFDITTTEPDGPIDWDTFALCVPKKYKILYDQLQTMSGKKFGKLLKKIFMATIDKAHANYSKEQHKAS